MQINLSLDSSVAQAPSNFMSLLNQGVQFLDQTFVNPITITIQIGWREIQGSALPSNVVGEAGPVNGNLYTYNQVRAALAANISSAADATSVANLPSSDPTRNGTFFIGSAEEKALGLISATAGGIDGAAGFQGTIGVGVIIHELTHAMGRIDFLGQQGVTQSDVGVFGLGRQAEFGPLDLFRYTGNGVLRPTAASAYFSIDGGRTAINTYDPTDPADWNNKTNDAFNSVFFGTNVPDPVTLGDLEEMDVLGYALANPTVTGIVLNLSNIPETVLGAPGELIVGGVGSAQINALSGFQTVLGGGGTLTVFAGPGDSIVAGASSAYIDGSSGGAIIDVGFSGTSDTIFGSLARNAGIGPDTLIGGGAVVAATLGQGDIVAFGGQSGSAVINAAAGGASITLGSGPASVFGGFGNTINFGTGFQYADGLIGGTQFVVGAAGSDTIVGSTNRASGIAPDTVIGGAASVQVQGLGQGDIVNFAGQTGNATVNATRGDIAVTLGSGAANVYGGIADRISLGTGSQYVDAVTGGASISVGGAGGFDLIVGSIAAASGAAGDTITGGAATVQIQGLGSGDVVNFAGQTGNSTVNATAGKVRVTLGSGGAAVYGGSGDTISFGSGAQYADAVTGGATINVGSAGSDTIVGSIAAASGAAGDTITGGAATVQIQGLGKGDIVNFANQTGNATVNATAGNIAVQLGSGNAAVYGGSGDTISLGSVTQYADAVTGGAKIAVGSGGVDAIVGAIAAAPGAAADTITGGAAAAQIQGLGKGDIVNFANQTGNSTVNATAGNVALTLGGGAAVVYAGAGDTINLGSGSQYVDGSAAPGALIVLGSAGTDNIIGSTVSGGAVETIRGGGGASLNYNIGVGGDLVDLAGSSGTAVVNAVGADIGPVNDTVIAGNGGTSVWGGQGDRIGVGVNASGTDLFAHSTTINGASIGFGTNGSAAKSSSAQVSVTGFAETAGNPTDYIFYQGESKGITDPIVTASTQTTVNGAASTVFTLPDGTVMTLIGVAKADFNANFFK